MTDKKTDNTDKKVETDSWLDTHDLNEIINTTNLAILPKYDIISESDLITTRKVIIDSLPIRKFIEKANKELDYITIIDNGIRYSLPFNSIALQRSYISMAIKESHATTKAEIDFSMILGKTYGLKREKFKAHGFEQSPLKFFSLEK